MNKVFKIREFRLL